MSGNTGLQLVEIDLFTKSPYNIPNDSQPISFDWAKIPGRYTTEYRDMILDPAIGGSTGLAVPIASVISEIPWVSSLISLGARNVLNGPYTEMVIKAASHRYGFGTSSTSARSALAVITLYCFVTVVYLSHILMSGHTSTAWNSATEFVVLASQSERTRRLRHTSVGINSIDTYREPVGIRVNRKDELELVLANDRDGNVRRLRRVAPKQAY